jgi:hypothetical protein
MGLTGIIVEARRRLRRCELRYEQPGGDIEKFSRGNAEEGEGILIAHGGEQEMVGIDGD